MPCELVVSEVGLIGLMEPSLPSVAATPSGGLAYQVREFLPAIAETGAAMVIASRDDRHAVALDNCPLDHPDHALRLGASRQKVKITTRGRERCRTDKCSLVQLF